MNNETKVIDFMNKNNGLITSKQINNLKIPRITLTRMVEKKIIEREKRGLYVFPSSFGDEYYNLLFSISDAVFSYNTALYLLGLSERVPLFYDITVPKGFNKSLRKNDKVKLHYVRKELFNLGIIKIKSPQGQVVICYNEERCICDMIKDKDTQDIEILKYAIKEYLSDKKRKNILKLNEYATSLGIEKELQNYLELLLWLPLRN